MVIALSQNWLLLGAASVVSLTAFIVLIMVPAMSSYGRWPEKVAAGFLALFIFGTLITVGILLGIFYVLWTNDIIVTDFFPWSGE